ncbi:MAG: 4-(cytidine 5'-diphospho)-2-C-methyl-D-erythritol kinase [Actinomycetia bacterium]|nr:4-(cytidine 5'-diphospho)-2-C-methyl-D-erythritol kinase [Actinomycetes bacterium]
MTAVDEAEFTTVRVHVPAKLNLSLRAGPRRRDGFHPLVTLFQAVSLYDEVSATTAEDGELSVTVTGEGADQVPEGSQNLAVRAAALLRERFGRPDQGAELVVRKQIPVAGGMAGGSADAAAALLACSVLWDLDTSPDDLIELAAELGSDVPFALVGGCAVGTGRGEQLAPALSRGSFHWVLAFAHRGLSTPDVFTRFDRLGQESRELVVPPALMNALATGDPRAAGKALTNDLQPAALTLYPELARTLEAGIECGALGGIVSGSGPTVAFLAAGESDAVDLSVRLSAEGLARAVRRVTGPVHGARLMS